MTSPVQISCVPAALRPRSAYCFITAEPMPDGTNTNSASAFASFARWTNGAKSGLASGARTDSTIVPPVSVKRLTNAFSESTPGA